LYHLCWGLGGRQALFPAPTLGAHLSVAAGFPTLFSTASGVFGLVAGPFNSVSETEFRVRLFSSLVLVVAPPACEPDQDTSAISLPRLDHLALVSHRFWRCVCQSHGSRLLTLRLPFVHSPAVSFLTSPALGSFSRGLPSLRGLPGARAPFVHLSVAFAGRFQTV
jgi:hypothetical protein